MWSPSNSRGIFPNNLWSTLDPHVLLRRISQTCFEYCFMKNLLASLIRVSPCGPVSKTVQTSDCYNSKQAGRTYILKSQFLSPLSNKSYLSYYWTIHNSTGLVRLPRLDLCSGPRIITALWYSHYISQEMSDVSEAWQLSGSYCTKQDRSLITVALLF